MGPVCCPEIPIDKSQATRRNKPQSGRPRLHQRRKPECSHVRCILPSIVKHCS